MYMIKRSNGQLLVKAFNKKISYFLVISLSLSKLLKEMSFEFVI